MKKLIPLLIILFSYGNLSAQTVTAPQLYKTMDSLANTLDSVVTKTILAPNAAVYNIDTLSLPVNSSGLFYLYYTSYDTVKKFVGNFYQMVFLNRIGSVYQPPYSFYNSVLYSTGLSTHQTSGYMNLANGIPVIQVSGFGNGSVIRWHVIIESKITPL
jgi:hypothetical protein